MSKNGYILKQGETESRTCTVDGDVVALHHVTQHGVGDAKKLVVCDWSFDFTGISSKQLRELASRSLVIDQRNAWKKLSEKDALVDSQTKQVFLVSDVLVKQRRGKTVAEKLSDLTKGMSAEQIASLIAEATK